MAVLSASYYVSCGTRISFHEIYLKVESLTIGLDEVILKCIPFIYISFFAYFCELMIY